MTWGWFAPSGGKVTWRWFAHPGHLIVGQDCRFHLNTLVGQHVVSTVGEWLPSEGSWDIYADSKGVKLEGRGDARRADFMQKVGFIEIGAGRLYETMVFKWAGSYHECGCPKITEWSELDMDVYNDAASAMKGHYAMCERWDRQEAK